MSVEAHIEIEGTVLIEPQPFSSHGSLNSARLCAREAKPSSKTRLSVRFPRISLGILRESESNSRRIRLLFLATSDRMPDKQIDLVRKRYPFSRIGSLRSG